MSLWLSRVLFAKAPRPYEVHQALWRAFPGTPGETRPFLFRADEVEGDKLRVLVQSAVAPAWDELGERLEEVSGPKPLSPALAAGARFRFFLRANPTVSRKGRDEPRTATLEGEEFRAARGRRVGIGHDEARVAWLLRRATGAGFHLAGGEGGALALSVSPPFAVQWRKGGHAARHDGVDFEGVLVVDDADKLGEALAKGLGPAKALGFGLLSLGAL